jgi:dGTP triphosphohydrolase
MKLFNKFYMADADGTGGPSRDDIKNTQTLKEQFASVKNTLEDVARILQRDIGTEILHMTESVQGFDEAAAKVAKGTLKDLTKELLMAAKAVEKTKLTSEGLTKGFVNSKKYQESIVALKARQSSIESNLLSLEMQGVQVSDDSLGNVKAANKALEQQIKLEERLLDKAIKAEKAAGKVGELFQGISKIPVLNKLVDSKEVLEAINKKAAETGSRWQALGAGIKETFASIGRSLLDPMTYVTGIFSLFQKIIELVLEFDARTFKIAKSLGVSVSEARTLQSQFIDIATSSKNFGLRIEEVSQSYGEISTQLGYLAPVQKGFAENAALIQKRTGASAESMEALARQSALTGKTLGETYGIVASTRVIEGARNKIALSTRQIMEGIAKVSSAIVINFKGSTEALSGAVIRATRLGTTLNDINKQGESLLDFETSIQKEFELQVLTGRNINLTRARELALMGNTAGLMEELNKQQVTYDSFMNENVIQRKAEADAIGLSVEELSKRLLLEKQAKVLGAEQGESLQHRYNTLMKTAEGQKRIKEQLSEQEQADLRRASIQDKFQAAIEKLKATLAEVLEGPVKGLIEGFINFISNGENIKKIANTLKWAFTGIADIIKNFPTYLQQAIPYLKIIGATLVGIMAASMISSLSMIPVVGPALGVAAAIAAAAAIGAVLSTPVPSFSIPPTSAEGMTKPVSPITANQQAQVPAPAAATTATNTNPNFNLFIDGQPVYASVRRNFETDHGLKKS